MTRLKHLRLDRGLAIAAVATALGVSNATLLRWFIDNDPYESG